jgi:hypothetical protein
MMQKKYSGQSRYFLLCAAQRSNVVPEDDSNTSLQPAPLLALVFSDSRDTVRNTVTRAWCAKKQQAEPSKWLEGCNHSLPRAIMDGEAAVNSCSSRFVHFLSVRTVGIL